MLKFLEALERRPPSHRLVRQLFLADGPVKIKHSPGANRNDELLAVTDRILSTAAASLEILTIMVSLRLEAVLSSARDMSSLRDLTCVVSYGEPESQLCALPNLRRVHLLALPRSGPLLALSNAAPRLTFLRWSDAARNPCVTGMLRDMMDEPAPGNPFSHRLMRVIVQPVPYRGGYSRCGTPRASQESMMHILQELADWRTPDVTLLAPRSSPTYMVKEAVRDWMEVCNGGDGCWRDYRTSKSSARLGKRG